MLNFLSILLSSARLLTYPTDLVVVSSEPTVVSEVVEAYSKPDPAIATKLISAKKNLAVHRSEGVTVVIDYGSGPLAVVRSRRDLIQAFLDGDDPLARIDLASTTPAIRAVLQPAVERAIGSRLTSARGRAALYIRPAVAVTLGDRTVHVSLNGASPIRSEQEAFLRAGPVERSDRQLSAQERSSDPTFAFTVVPSSKQRGGLLVAAAQIVSDVLTAEEDALRQIARAAIDRAYGDAVMFGPTTFDKLDERLRSHCLSELSRNYRWLGFEGEEEARSFFERSERLVVGAELSLTVYEIGEQRRFISSGVTRYF